jgi:N-acetylglutamate synthase-like GNAT family acetyltransferase
MTFVIRSATEKDINLITNIIRASFFDVAIRFNLTVKNAPTHPSNCTEAWIKTALEKGIKYYILEYNSIPCGCIALEQANVDICYIERLSVLPKYRKQGFGRDLVHYALKEAKKIGAKRVEIGIMAEHKELKEWYIKQGFYKKNIVSFEHLPFSVAFMFIEI